MHGKINVKKKIPDFFFFFLLLHSQPFLHTHTLPGFPLISFFYLEGQRQREREREEKEKKLSYRFELHTVSILPSLNDLNKEFNTAGSE